MIPFENIAHIRLYNQYLSHPTFTNPYDVVKHLGAVQAQDYLGSLWSIGMRMDNATESVVEESVNKGHILRTWPMRGTIHFVAAEDAKWMVKLLAGRINKKLNYYYKQVGLDETVFGTCRSILTQELEKKTALTRQAIYKLWEAAGIETKSSRGLFIIGHLAQEATICFGPRQGKQPTFVLLDSWVKNHTNLDGEAAIAELMIRYFRSHGPAQIKDFMWWSGLTQKEIKSAIHLVKDVLISETIDDKTYFFTENQYNKTKESTAYLQQPYDEYTVAYKDRSALEHPLNKSKALKQVKFYSIVIIDGKLAGFWKRSITKNGLTFEFDFLRKLTKSELQAVEKAKSDYANFLNLKIN